MNTRSPYWKLVEVERPEHGGKGYLKLTYWNGIDQYHRFVPDNIIQAEWVYLDVANEMLAYQDFLRALPDDQCREIVNARRFLQVVHQAMSEASKPKVGDEVCLNNVPLGSVCQIQNDHTPERVLVNHSGWRKDGWTPRFASGWVPTRQVKPVVLPYRLAECQAAFAPEHHKELAELIYLHDGDLRERWMLFTDMLEEGRWGDKYQLWAKHILEVIENLGSPLTIYDEVFQPDHEHDAIVMKANIQRRFVNLTASSDYCMDQIIKSNGDYFSTHITSIGPP